MSMLMDHEPLVSVIIPAYNAAAYIAQTVDSVVHQTYADFEVIVVNDGSHDTESLERKLAGYGDRVRYIFQQNGGPSSARNTGIRAAQGELVAFLDSDDIWEPEFLATQVACFRRNPKLDLVWCNCSRLGALANERTQFNFYPPRRPVTLESLIRIQNVPVTSTVVARKETVIDAGLFDESMRRAEDFDLWLRMATNGAQFDFQDQLLGRRRNRPTSLSADIASMSEGASVAYDKLAVALGGDHRLIPVIRGAQAKYAADVYQELANKRMDEGNWNEAIGCIEQANAMVPTKTRSSFLAVARVSMPMAIAVARMWRGRARNRSE